MIYSLNFVQKIINNKIICGDQFQPAAVDRDLKQKMK